MGVGVWILDFLYPPVIVKLDYGQSRVELYTDRAQVVRDSLANHHSQSGTFVYLKLMISFGGGQHLI